MEQSALVLVNKIAFNPRKGYASATGETYWDFASKLKRRMGAIVRSLRARTYKFDLCLKRRKRTKGRVRDLYISAWGDRIVERWLNDCLNILLTHWFSRHSYAYRVADLGLDGCQRHVANRLTPTACIIKRDVTSFFYTISHELLLGKIAKLVEPTDFLFELLRQRIQFHYDDGTGQNQAAVLGVPFGSSLACSLANIYLTDLDKEMIRLPIDYFRYADDFLILTDNPETALAAGEQLDAGLADLKLSCKETHHLQASFADYPGFVHVKKFKYLGLEFTNPALGGITARLPVEKQRKLLNLFRMELERHRGKFAKLPQQDRVLLAVAVVNQTVVSRIRSAAIVDYYLKHVDDDAQLRQLDLSIAQLIIAAVLDKPFRWRDFATIPFATLRAAGLISLRHRRRLHSHGHLKTSFLSIHNEIVHDRHLSMLRRRRERIDQMRIGRKLRQVHQT